MPAWPFGECRVTLNRWGWGQRTLRAMRIGATKGTDAPLPAGVKEMGASYRDYQRRTEARRLGRPDPVKRDGHDIDEEGGLSHLVVVGHADSTRGSPRWIVEHYGLEDSETPTSEHTFSD